jgi:N-acetylmuramoyl-L-alanine amidase
MITVISRFVGVVVVALLILGGQAVSRATAEQNLKGFNGKGMEALADGGMVCYTVRKGDTLSGIAANFDISLRALVKANKLDTTLIHPDDVMLIPGRSANLDTVLSRGNISREELYLLARVIYAEARGESFTGQVAVGAVILNRLDSPQFPETIREIIMQKNKNTYQFSPVADGSINLEPDKTAINAAVQALLGWDPTNGALFFYNPHIASDKWIKTLPVMARIGNHVFASRT